MHIRITSKCQKFAANLLRVLFIVAGCLTFSANATEKTSVDWRVTLDQARGQQLYFHAWGGSQQINSYIKWVATQVKEQFDVTLNHVKISDTALIVKKIIRESAAGRTNDNGSVDLIWLNGENFRTLKVRSLLFGPFAEDLPNFSFVDTVNKPTTTLDFGVPTAGYEAPWGMAQLVFMYDSATLQNPPKTLHAMLKWAEHHQGRMTYPKPPDFIGTTFLKQIAYATIADTQVLQQPASTVDTHTILAPMWKFLDRLHAAAWQQGQTFANNIEDQMRLLNDGEIDFALAFNPAEASSKIVSGQLPDTVRTFVLDGGTIGNTHFVAIPKNAQAKAAAQVVANFLMSPTAQIRKQNPTEWGDFTVLNVDKLTQQQQQQFAALPLGVATLSPQQLGSVLPEPDASWTTVIESEWRKRYQ